MDKVREEFEAWYSDKFKYSDNTLVKNDETYLSPFADGLWSAWRASRESIVVNLPEHCKGNALTVSELKEQLDKEGIKYDF